MIKQKLAKPFGSLETIVDSKRQYRIYILSCLIITLCLVSIYLFNPRFVQFLSFKLTDTIQALVVLPESEMNPEIVAIDEKSLEKYGQWPWPRYLIAQLLSEINSASAKAISIDILFPEQDRSSPTTWLEGATEKFGLKLDVSTELLNLVDFDHYLAEALEQGPFVLGYSLLFGSNTSEVEQCNLRSVFPMNEAGQTSFPSTFTFYQAKGAVCNYQPLANAVNYSGFLNANPDSDGMMRRLPLVIDYGKALYPSFALAAIMQFYPDTAARIQPGKTVWPSMISIGKHSIPVNSRGDYLLNKYDGKEPKYISAADVLAKELDENVFRNNLVLVGLSASGLNQDLTTPFARNLSTLDLHRISIKTLTANFHTVRTELFPLLEAGFTILLCLLLFFLIVKRSSLTAGLCGFVIIFLIWISAWLVYRQTGNLFSPLLPSVAVLLNYFVLTTLKFNFSSQLANSEKGSALHLLHTSEENLQSILNTIPDIIFRLDENGKINFVSPAVSSYKEASSLLGRSIFDLVEPHDLIRAKHRLNERRTGDRATLDFEISLRLTKNVGEQQGIKRYFSVSAEGIYSLKPGQEDLCFMGTQCIARDITKRKRLENQLLQAQKMEVVGNLAAGIAHDLNNILSGLVSYPDLLLSEIPVDDPLHKKISIIQSSGKKAAVIVQDLLTLARRNTNILDLCNLNSIITEYLESAEFHLLQSKNSKVKIIKDLAPDLFNVKGSAAHLSKLIMNVLHNAIEAMPAGGAVCISTENVFVDCPLERYEEIPIGKYSCVSVTDTGVGISKEDIARIFEPFYTKKSMNSSGTGIGMTVIWATIKDHRGYIDISSREGDGTVLSFYIPSTEETESAEDQKVVLQDFIGSESILIVDDVLEQREIGEKMLTKLGYKVQTVASGEEAIQVLKRENYELLVLDMIMPGGLDGLSTYEAICQFKPGQKAIITSGFSESQRVSELLNLGAGAYIQKPFTLEEIGIAVRSQLDR